MDAYQTEIYRDWRIDISYDDDVESPRDWENICTMHCYHRSRVLGDNQSKGDPWVTLRELIGKYISPKELIQIIIENCKSLKIDSQNVEGYYTLYEKYNGEWYTYKDYLKDDELDSLADDILYCIDEHELFTILDNCSEVAISNIYAYEHSGITISMSRNVLYACPFDSGCLGFIYVTKKTIKDNWRGTTDENWKEKAFEVMANEVSVYDAWLRGECFGWLTYAPVEYDGEEPVEWEDWCEDSACGYIGDKDIELALVDAKAAIDYQIKRREQKKEEARIALNKLRCEIHQRLHKILGKRFIVDDTLYEINTNNLFDYPQIEVFTTANGRVATTGMCVSPFSLDDRAVSVISAAIEQIN